MAAHRLVNFDGGVFNSDAANSAGAGVERDGNGDALVSGLSAGPQPASAPTTGSFLSTAGALMGAGTTQTTNNTLTAASTVIQRLNAAGGAFTQTLPVAATSTNLIYFLFKSEGSVNVPTIKGNGTDNITAGGATANTYAGLTALGSHVALWCDGTQWWQIA